MRFLRISSFFHAMEQRTFKNVNNYLTTNIYSYLEASGGQSSNLYLNVVHFSTPELIRIRICDYCFPALVSNMPCSILFFTRVTDNKSSSILIYFWTCKSIYTQKNGLIKRWLNKLNSKEMEFLIRWRANLLVFLIW